MSNGSKRTSHESSMESIDHERALGMLVDGNLRYQTGATSSSNPCPSQIDLESGQAPFAAFIRCADSRVAPEIVFDQPLGSLFVCGVAGNIPTPEIVASLEYAVLVLGTRLIVIMGHSACGAVTAALEHPDGEIDLPGELPGLIEKIRPCTRSTPRDSESALEHAIRKNAVSGVSELLEMSAMISKLVATRELQIVAGIQDLKSGRFSLVKKAFD